MAHTGRSRPDTYKTVKARHSFLTSEVPLRAQDPKTTEAASDLLCELAYISRDVQQCMPIFQVPLPSELGTHTTVKARFWP